MWTGIAHIALTVPDMQAALNFYVDKLGFKHAFTIKNDEGKPTIEYLMISPGQFVELFYAKEGFENRKGSFAHLCLQTDDVRADVERLRAAGVHIRVEVKQGRDKNFQAWVDDPAGNPIELMQISEESPQYHASNS